MAIVLPADACEDDRKAVRVDGLCQLSDVVPEFPGSDDVDAEYLLRLVSMSVIAQFWGVSN